MRGGRDRAQERDRPAGGRRLIRPADGIARISPGAQPDEPEFPRDAGIAHRPTGSRFQGARCGPVLVVGPAGTVLVHRRAARDVIDQRGRERQVDALFDVQVAHQRQDARRAAAPAAVVPETRPALVRQPGRGHGVPTPVDQRPPRRVRSLQRSPSNRDRTTSSARFAPRVVGLSSNDSPTVCNAKAIPVRPKYSEQWSVSSIAAAMPRAGRRRHITDR